MRLFYDVQKQEKSCKLNIAAILRHKGVWPNGNVK
jgi:hypothetical protein